MKLELEHYKEAYFGCLHNRNVVNKKVGVTEKGFRIYFQSFGYALIVILKVILSVFFKARSRKEIIFVSWGKLHTTLAKRLGLEPHVVVLNYALKKDQIAFFKDTSLLLAVKYASKIKLAGRDMDNGYDNVFFCFATIVEFQMLRNLVENASHIYMAGQIDRYAIMLSILAREGKKEFSFVQHGVNNVFEGLYRLKADNIYYLFGSSIPFFHSFLIGSENAKYFPIPSVKPNYKVDPRFKNAIGFASQILDSDLDILDIIIENYDCGEILIYPHPTEKSIKRYQKYADRRNVFLCREKVANINYLISSGSTLGMEYDLIGVPPVFINTLNIKSEIFLSKKFISFPDLESFKEWFQKEVVKKDIVANN